MRHLKQTLRNSRKGRWETICGQTSLGKSFKTFSKRKKLVREEVYFSEKAQKS